MSDEVNDVPTPGVVIWPVGCGDSITLRVTDEIVMQVDLHHMKSSEESETPTVAVIDRLEALLPKRHGRPYLAVAAFTHLDEDHCRGAEYLLDRVDVGELWLTPRSFVEAEAKGDMCEDAQALHTEALRRLAEVLKYGDDTPSGDRLRIVGYSDVLDDLGFDNYPEELKSIPGTVVTVMDGKDVSDVAEVFLHSPFRDDCDGDERNSSSLGMRITLGADDRVLRILLLGDLGHEVLGRLLEVSDDADLEWDVFLAPHHCSKGAVIDDDGNEDTDVTDRLGETAAPGAWIVASAPPFPTADSKGANPPHLAARAIYERIVGADHFRCTGENGDKDNPVPLVFEPTQPDTGVVPLSASVAKGLLVGAAAIGAAALIGRAVRPGDKTIPRGDRRFA